MSQCCPSPSISNYKSWPWLSIPIPNLLYYQQKTNISTYPYDAATSQLKIYRLLLYQKPLFLIISCQCSMPVSTTAAVSGFLFCSSCSFKPIFLSLFYFCAILIFLSFQATVSNNIVTVASFSYTITTPENNISYIFFRFKNIFRMKY